MPKFALFAPAFLVACSTAPADPAPIPVHGVTPGHKCATAGTVTFVGQAGTKSSGAAILRASHAAVLRWAPPGVMLTMDYREDRVTIHLDARNRIADIKCG